MPMNGRHSRGGNLRSEHAGPFLAPATLAKPRRVDGLAGQTGKQGRVECPVCQHSVQQVLCHDSIPEFGYKAKQTRLIPNHTPEGHEYRARRGDRLCRASMLTFEDAKLLR